MLILLGILVSVCPESSTELTIQSINPPDQPPAVPTPTTPPAILLDSCPLPFPLAIELSMNLKPFKGGLPWLAVATVCTTVSVGGWMVYATTLNRQPTPLSVRLETVKTGDVEVTINEVGTVELGQQQVLTSPIQGAIERVLVKPGQAIKRKQTLISLRYPERETVLTNQTLQIKQQQINLQRQRQRVKELEAELTSETAYLKNLQSLAEQGVLSQQQVQQQQDRVRSRATAMADLTAQIGQGELELQRLQVDRRRIQEELATTLIKSPINGKVLDVYVESGDGMEFRTPLLSVGDPKQEWVRLQLSTLNAAQVRRNQVVRVSAIGPRAKTYPGRMQFIYPQAAIPGANPTNQASSTDPSTVAALVRLDRPTRKLIPGSQVNVEIVVKQRQDVVTLPLEFIQREGRKSFVWVRDGQGKAQKQAIALGLEGLLDVEVKDGLQAGQQVIFPVGDTPLQPGMPVEAKPNTPQQLNRPQGARPSRRD